LSQWSNSACEAVYTPVGAVTVKIGSSCADAGPDSASARTNVKAAVRTRSTYPQIT